jgi:hypothetical protein
LYADLINKKITPIVVPEKKQRQVDKLKSSILNMADVRAWGAMEQLWEAIHNCSYG